MTEADFVVVGSGGAGLTGALVAALQGLEVCVLEKTELVGGTTALSGGGVWIAANHHMAERGVEDSREEALAYLRGSCGDAADDSLLVTLVDRGPELVRVLESAGLSFRPYPAEGGCLDYRTWLPGWKPGARALDSGKVALAPLGDWAERVRTGSQSAWVVDKFDFFVERWHTQPPTSDRPSHYSHAVVATEKVTHVANGTALIAQLLREALARGVHVETNAPVDELLLEDDRVVGVRSGERRIRARRGVLIATGGFAHNDELKRRYLTRPLELSCELRSNQGDGQLLGLAAGAQLANMEDAWWGPMLPLKGAATADRDAVLVREDRSLPHTLMVDATGRRFVNESMNYYDVVAAFDALPAWVIFDSQARRKYRIFGRAPVDPAPGRFGGSFGNDPVEAGRPLPSWLVRADTLRALAAEIGVDADTLEATVERFNSFARSGRDEDFGRGETAWDLEWGDPNHRPNPALGTVEAGPFYAAEIRPGAFATKGGLRIDADGRVLSGGDPPQPIEGLYAAGNCAAGAPPGAYPGPGSTLGAALTFAYVAAMHAAARS